MNNISQAQKIGEKIISFNIAPEVLWFLLALVLIFFIIMSAVFSYHWKHYVVKDDPKIFAKSLYWIVSFILILIMLIGVSLFENL